MSKFAQVCCLGLALAAFGCGGSTSELGPATTEPKQMSQDEINQKIKESMQKSSESGRGPQLEAPGGDKK